LSVLGIAGLFKSGTIRPMMTTTIETAPSHTHHEDLLVDSTVICFYTPFS
jgi:hypothetical protein